MNNVSHNLGKNEVQRLQAAVEYSQDRADHYSVFDRFTALAAALFEVPIATISLIDQDRIRFKSSIGLNVASVPRRGIFCDAVAASDHIMIVEDTLADTACRASDMASILGVRFYAGAPLIMPDGSRIGAFAIADTSPRAKFGENARAILAELARAVVAEMELCRRFDENRDIVDALSLRNAIAADAAAATSFRDALERVLTRTGRRLDAGFCSVVEVDRQAETFRFVAGYNPNQAMKAAARGELREPNRPIADLYCAPALIDNAVVDCLLDDAERLAAYPLLAKAALIGARRMYTFPLTIGERRFGLSVGFKSITVSEATLSFCGDLATWLAPLLQGHIREEALTRANALLDRSNRALQTLQSCQEAMAGAESEAALAQAVCDLAVEVGRYSAAWVGIAEADEAATLRPVAVAGIGIDRVWTVPISWADNPRGRGPSGTCIREGRPVTVNDYLTDPRMAPWRGPGDQTGRTSIIALPLHDDAGSCFGCLSLFAHDRANNGLAAGISFDAEEVGLLTRLAATLAYGIATLRSRAARDAAVAERHRSERHLARLLEASPTVVYALEPRTEGDPSAWSLVEMSANLERLYGHDPLAARTPHWWIDHVHPDDRAGVIAQARRLHDDGTLVLRYRFARGDGTYRWLRDDATLVPATADSPRRIVGTWIDITEKHQADEAIHRLAYFDTLTGLPNRAMLRNHIQAELDGARAAGMKAALLYVDLNGFEAINDLHGHAVGDIVLEQVARRLPRDLRRSDVVARLGGDKFAILLARLALTTEQAGEIVERIARTVLLTLALPIHAAGHECYVTADIGIALFPHRSDVIDDVMHQADIALHQAKLDNRSPIVFFEADMQDRMAERHSIELALRDAVEHDRFEVWLQSQVGAEGMVTGAEALIRLRRPDGVLVPPTTFIPIAEKIGTVFAMGRWMLHAVCRILAARAACGRNLRISINVSPRQFHDPDFVTDIETALRETGADPHDLMIEITENLLIERIDETTAILHLLAHRGIRFSIDDFGTGYSSLGYLQNLPIAEIKIDRSFIQRLPDNPRDATLAEAILSMTRNLGLATVAEGVETEAQAAFLRYRHCDTMQGYLFGHPEPAAVWLERHCGV